MQHSRIVAPPPLAPLGSLCTTVAVIVSSEGPLMLRTHALFKSASRRVHIKLNPLFAPHLSPSDHPKGQRGGGAFTYPLPLASSTFNPCLTTLIMHKNKFLTPLRATCATIVFKTSGTRYNNTVV